MAGRASAERARVRVVVHFFSLRLLIVERRELTFAMNPMNDQRFFDLAMKSITRQGTPTEQAELEALLASHSDLKTEFERLQADARLAREVAPLVAATQSSGGEFPTYARERLQGKVRQTLGQPVTSERREGWNWRWALGLAGAAAIITVFLVPALTRPTTPLIQLALLDVAGATRGSETNEVTVMKQQWPEASVRIVETPSELATWEESWLDTDRLMVKVIHDRAAGEVRVRGRRKGEEFQAVFKTEPDLAAALRQTDAFIREKTRR